MNTVVSKGVAVMLAGWMDHISFHFCGHSIDVSHNWLICCVNAGEWDPNTSLLANRMKELQGRRAYLKNFWYAAGKCSAIKLYSFLLVYFFAQPIKWLFGLSCVLFTVQLMHACALPAHHEQ